MHVAAYACVYRESEMGIGMCAYSYVYNFAYVYVYMYICIYVNMYICAYMHMHVYK